MHWETKGAFESPQEDGRAGKPRGKKAARVPLTSSRMAAEPARCIVGAAGPVHCGGPVGAGRMRSGAVVVLLTGPEAAAAAGMWYEILPSAAIMYTFLVIPGLATTFFQKLENGGKPKRIIRTPHNWFMMERDKRVSDTGLHFDAKGLENID